MGVATLTPHRIEIVAGVDAKSSKEAASMLLANTELLKNISLVKVGFSNLLGGFVSDPKEWGKARDGFFTVKFACEHMPEKDSFADFEASKQYVEECIRTKNYHETLKIEVCSLENPSMLEHFCVQDL